MTVPKQRRWHTEPGWYCTLGRVLVVRGDHYYREVKFYPLAPAEWKPERMMPTGHDEHGPYAQFSSVYARVTATIDTLNCDWYNEKSIQPAIYELWCHPQFGCVFDDHDIEDVLKE